MKGGAGVGLPSLNGIWTTWLAIVVIIWTSEIDFRKSQQRRWRCAYLFSKETNPKKKKKKTKKNIFQFQMCLSMSTFFSPSKREEEDNNDDDVAPKKKRKRGRRPLRAGVSIVRPRKRPVPLESRAAKRSGVARRRGAIDARSRRRRRGRFNESGTFFFVSE